MLSNESLCFFLNHCYSWGVQPPKTINMQLPLPNPSTLLACQKLLAFSPVEFCFWPIFDQDLCNLGMTWEIIDYHRHSISKLIGIPLDMFFWRFCFLRQFLTWCKWGQFLALSSRFPVFARYSTLVGPGSILFWHRSVDWGKKTVANGVVAGAISPVISLYITLDIQIPPEPGVFFCMFLGVQVPSQKGGPGCLG